MDMLLTVLISGIFQGSLYALIGLGFVIIYKSSSIFNFAQGELVMIGGFLGWTFLSSTNLGLWLSFACILIVAALLGLTIQKLFVAPLTGQPVISAILMTLGLASILNGITIMVWDSSWRVYPAVFPKRSLIIAGANVSLQGVIILALVIISFCLFLLFFNKTRTGLGMRAAAEDHQAARGIGINVSKMFSINWMVACIFAALGGFLLSTVVGVVPALSQFGLRSLAPVLLGGLESILGVVIGGILIGVIENLVGYYIDPFVGGGSKEIVSYVIIIVILIFRPYGFFGLKKIERV